MRWTIAILAVVLAVGSWTALSWAEGSERRSRAPERGGESASPGRAEEGSEEGGMSPGRGGEDDRGEGEGGRRPRRPRRMRRRPHPLLHLFDTDRNGEISAGEIEKASEVLKGLDANGDGKLTPEEMRPPRPRGGEEGSEGAEPRVRRRPRGGEEAPENAEGPRRPRRGRGRGAPESEDDMGE